MNKNKLVLPISILLGSIILGGFYYSSEQNKLQSIERQQIIELESKENDEKKEVVKLENCLDIVEQEFERTADILINFHNNECIAKLVKNGEATKDECLKALADSAKEDEIEKEKDINNCYKRYK